MDTEIMLTTFDNPFDPFDDFVPWLMFDKEQGYNTCEKIARIARTSSDFSTIEDKMETERAIDEIILNDFLNIYKKVTRKIVNDEEETEKKEETVGSDTDETV